MTVRTGSGSSDRSEVGAPPEVGAASDSGTFSEISGSSARLRPLATGVPVLVLALVVSGVVAVGVGPAGIRPNAVLLSAWHHLVSMLAMTPSAGPLDTLQEAIVWRGRAPRVVCAGAVGAGLALSGTVLQALTGNPLADPYLLGVSSGAAVGAVSVLVLAQAARSRSLPSSGRWRRSGRPCCWPGSARYNHAGSSWPASSSARAAPRWSP